MLDVSSGVWAQPSHCPPQRTTPSAAKSSGFCPSVVVLTQPGKWTLGALANQIWSTSGAKDRAAVNQFYLQPFVNYNLGSGLAVGVSMEASASRKAQEKWTAPLLFSVSKVTLLGKRPVNLALPRAPLL